MDSLIDLAIPARPHGPLPPALMPSPRLLAVDDEAVQRTILARAAARLGFVADTAATLEEAIARVATTRYDVVVLDLDLHGHDGIELLRSLRHSGAAPSVVFVSGFDQRVRLAAARLAGAIGLPVAGTLGKPLRLDRLASLLGSLPAQAGAAAAAPDAEIDPALLAAAIDRGEIHCLFQPKVALTGRRLIGVETLARWNSPVLGPVSPTRFIPAAERAGLIDRLTWCVLREALAAFPAWRAGSPDLTLAVNVSPLSLTDLALPERISDLLAEAGVPAGSLVLEVTEGAVLADYVRAADILTRLRIRGVKLSVDDFGTGHSSLLSLLRLPFSEVKIDQSFVRTCQDDPEARKIIRAVVSMAREMDLQLVAEGIETETVADMVERLGCAVGQGYLFAPPLKGAEIGDRIGAE
jgi:EAL domain-containing protein (putative c-di-GMP-specific phosphodiesterase class I)/ActR/RegA family two-component response regulator